MSAKQAITDKLQGNVATHLRCGGVANKIKLTKVYCWVCEEIFLIGEYLAKLQARTSLSRALVRSSNTLLKTEKVHETITFLFVTLPNIHRFLKNHSQTEQ